MVLHGDVGKLSFFVAGMCRHTGILVCFACLFLSAHSSSHIQDKNKSEEMCSATKLFEIHSSNGSLSLEGLDQILKSVRSLCSSYWKEKEETFHHVHTVSEVAPGIEDSEKPVAETESSESSTKNGNYCC